MMGAMGDSGAMTGGMIVMCLLWLIFSLILIVLLILGVLALIRYLSGGGGKRRGHDTIDVLKERYAKGEITREQYKKMRTDIEGSS